MARGSDQAKTAATTAQTNSNALTGNANGIFSTLAPQLAATAANPQGFDPATLARMNTGAMQTAGGITSGAQGKGALLAGRTRNAGTADAAISDAARSGSQALSQEQLSIENENAKLKEHQREQALGAEQGIYGTNVSGANNALGQVAGDVNADVNAQNASYNWLKPVSAIADLANAGSKFI